MPESMMKTRNASINLRRFDVLSLYDFHNASMGVAAVVEAFCEVAVALGPAMSAEEYGEHATIT